MKEYYIGLDIHKDSILMAVLDDRKVRSNEKADSDVVEVREVPAHSPKLVKAIKNYQGRARYLRHTRPAVWGLACITF
jgi:hypothetical protein